MDTSVNIKQKRCVYCRRFFRPDRRVGARQKSCKEKECQKRRKAESQKRWVESNAGSKTDMIVVEPGDLVISGINVSKGAIAVYHGEDAITAKGGIGNIKLLIKIHKCGVQEVIDATYCLYFFLLDSILNFWSNQSSTDS